MVDFIDGIAGHVMLGFLFWLGGPVVFFWFGVLYPKREIQYIKAYREKGVETDAVIVTGKRNDRSQRGIIGLIYSLVDLYAECFPTLPPTLQDGRNHLQRSYTEDGGSKELTYQVIYAYETPDGNEIVAKGWVDLMFSPISTTTIPILVLPEIAGSGYPKQRILEGFCGMYFLSILGIICGCVCTFFGMKYLMELFNCTESTSKYDPPGYYYCDFPDVPWLYYLYVGVPYFATGFGVAKILLRFTHKNGLGQVLKKWPTTSSSEHGLARDVMIVLRNTSSTSEQASNGNDALSAFKDCPGSEEEEEEDVKSTSIELV